MRRAFLLIFTFLIGTTSCEQLIAQCSFSEGVNSGATGSLYFTQNKETGGSLIDMSKATSPEGIGWHIHEYAITKPSCGATIAGGHYNPGTSCSSPCVNSPTCTCVGELTAKWGDFNAAKAITPIVDGEVKLSGSSSVAGRSIVIHNANGTRIACCTLKIIQGLFGEDVGYTETVYTSTCAIDTRATIKITQLSVNSTGVRKGSKIEVSINDPTQKMVIPTGDSGLHIHETKISGSTDCSRAGGHYNPEDSLNFVSEEGKSMGLGELSWKHGAPRGPGGVYTATYQDAAVNLVGPWKVSEKSVVIHSPVNNSRIGCCDFAFDLGTPPINFRIVDLEYDRLASCEFDNGQVSGTIWFENKKDMDDGVHIWSDGIKFELTAQRVGTHSYHIHSYGDKTSACANSGPHYGNTYTMGYFGPDQNGFFWNSKGWNMEIGDLSGKHGVLQDSIPFDYYDASVALEGQYSILGRSITIHDTAGAKYACCIIGLTNPVALSNTFVFQSETTTNTAGTNAGSNVNTNENSTSDEDFFVPRESDGGSFPAGIVFGIIGAIIGVGLIYAAVFFLYKKGVFEKSYSSGGGGGYGGGGSAPAYQPNSSGYPTATAATGADPIYDPHAKSNIRPPAPVAQTPTPPWYIATSDLGETYYYNETTGESSWDFPG